MSGKLTRTLLLAAALTAISASAQALTITFDPITAAWTSIVPASGITSTGNGTTTASLRWGVSQGSGQSGYDFTAAIAPLNVVMPPDPSNEFSLGLFTHFNNPITGTTLSSATLEVTAFLKLIDDSNVATDIGNRTFSFNFVHNETPNADDPCANGQPNGSGVNVNGCADIITVSVSSGTESFSIGGVDYTLGVQGFLATSGPNIGTLVTGFQTVEAATNTAQIVTIADKTENVLVPEPGILALLSGGLLGLGLALRRRGPGHWGRAAFSAA